MGSSKRAETGLVGECVKYIPFVNCITRSESAAVNAVGGAAYFTSICKPGQPRPSLDNVKFIHQENRQFSLKIEPCINV